MISPGPRPCRRSARWAAGAAWSVSLLAASALAQAPAPLLPAPPVPLGAPAGASGPAPLFALPRTVVPCPVRPAYPLPRPLAQLNALLAQIDAQAEACLLDAPYHAWRGAVLLQLARPAAAIESLERALLIDPDLPGAQLDYAQALAAAGDPGSARALLADIARRPDLLPALRPLLAQELGAAPDRLAWRYGLSLATALGHDSNLNNAPAASELTLTFPQGAVTLPVAQTYLPQAGTSWLNRLQAQAFKAQGEQLWLLQAELRARHTQDAATRYQQADVSVNWLQAPAAPRQWILRAGAGGVDFGGQRLLQSARAGALHQWQTGAWLPGSGMDLCRTTAGLELETRRYPATRQLDGRYTGLALSASCSAPEAGSAAAGAQPGAGFSHRLVNVQLRAGSEEAARADRPGGRFARLELRGAWEGQWATVKLAADYAYTQQNDASGYSPLLSDNLPRATYRHSLRLEAAHPLAAGPGAPEGFVSVEGARQASNLPVFASRQSAVYGGLRWRLP